VLVIFTLPRENSQPDLAVACAGISTVPVLARRALVIDGDGIDSRGQSGETRRSRALHWIRTGVRHGLGPNLEMGAGGRGLHLQIAGLPVQGDHTQIGRLIFFDPGLHFDLIVAIEGNDHLVLADLDVLEFRRRTLRQQQN